MISIKVIFQDDYGVVLLVCNDEDFVHKCLDKTELIHWDIGNLFFDTQPW